MREEGGGEGMMSNPREMMRNRKEVAIKVMEGI
jgi:hypothetical protein